MCLIVDVNVAPRILLTDNDRDFSYVHISLFGSKKPIATLAYGGKLLDEFSRNHQLTRKLAELDRAGRARIVEDHLIEEQLELIVQLGLCRSDDEHIIALARAGKVRLLCSFDKALHADFRNKALLDNPRGKVYQNRKHKRLLTEFCR